MRQYKEFRIGDFFNLKNNPQLDKRHFTFSKTGQYPYFTRTENNNGILGYVDYLDDEHKIQGNVLAVGMISMRFHYISHDFYAGQFTKTLIPKFREFNELIALYFIAELNARSVYYQKFLVREFAEKVLNTELMLPSTLDGTPDFEYMRDYIAELEVKHIAELKTERTIECEAYLDVAKIDSYELTDADKEVLARNADKTAVRVGDLFDGQTGDVDLQTKDIDGKGEYFINSGVQNQGIKGRTSRPARTFPANTITVDFFGNAYLRDFKFKMATHNHVFALVEKFDIPHDAKLYIVGVLNKLSAVHSFNNMLTWTVLQDVEIWLPVAGGKPDFDYMSAYICVQKKLAIQDIMRGKDRIVNEMSAIVKR